MQPRGYPSNTRDPVNQGNPQNTLPGPIRTISGDNQLKNYTSNYPSYNTVQPNPQVTPRTPNTQYVKTNDRFNTSSYHQSSRSVNPNYTSNTFVDANYGTQRSIVKPLRYDESQITNQTILSLQNSSSQIPGNPVYGEVPVARTSYISQKPGQSSPRVTVQQHFSTQGNLKPQDLASRLADGQELRSSAIEELEQLPKEELVMRLKNSETIINELKKMISSLRSGMNEKDEVFKLSRQVQDLTTELVGLREQNFKLKNLANDELLILEKVETKEVYGKKSKVQEELEQARRMRLEYESLMKTVQQKETVITTHEKQIIELKTVIDRTNNQLNTMRRVNEEIRSTSQQVHEIEQLRKELEGKNGLLARKDAELKDEQAKTSSYLKSMMEQSKQIEAMKNGLAMKQNESEGLRRELNKPAQVVVERVVPQELQQELQQLRTGQVLKEKELAALSQSYNGSNQRVRELESQLAGLQKSLRDFEAGQAGERKDISELRARFDEALKQLQAKDKLLQDAEIKIAGAGDLRSRISVLEAMLDERNKYIVALENDKRGTVTNEEFNGLLHKAREIEALNRDKDRELFKSAELLETKGQQLKEQAELIAQLRGQLEAQGPGQSQSQWRNSFANEQGSADPEGLRRRLLQLEAALQDRTRLLEERSRELARLKEEIANFKFGDAEVNDGKIPAELNRIVIEQQRVKLDNYKNMVESYQKDIENLKVELDYLRRHDGNEGAFLRSQLELKNSEVNHLHKSLQELKLANAELEAALRGLREQRASALPRVSETHVTERVSEVVSEEINRAKTASRRTTHNAADDEFEEVEDLRGQKRRLEDQRRKDHETVRELRGTVNKLEFELEQLANDNKDLDRQLKEQREELKRHRKEAEGDAEFKEKLKRFLEASNFDKAFLKRILEQLASTEPLELLRRVLEQLQKERSKIKTGALAEGVQVAVDVRTESTQTEFVDVSPINIRLGSPISRSNRSHFDLKDNANFQKLEEELEDLKGKYMEQVSLNQQIAEKNAQLLEENAGARLRLREVKERKSEYKKIVNKTYKDAEERKSSRNNIDSVSRISVDENQQGLKIVLEQLREKQAQFNELELKYRTLRESIVKRKKALLNELGNFVNTKNNFENSLFSEITRSSTTEIIILPH